MNANGNIRGMLEPRTSNADWLPALLMTAIAAAVWGVYGSALRAPPVFDDAFSVVNNRSITKLWPLVGDATHPGPLNPPPELPTSGRPLVNLSFAINYRIGGLNPLGYHVVNVLLHMLSAFLVFAILRRTLRLEFFAGRFDGTADLLAFAIALVWGVHPLNTEAVEYVTQRTELMVGLFYLATLYASIRYWTSSPTSRTRWLLLAAASCMAGMASKETMVSAPLVVLLFERTFVTGSFREAWKRSWPLYMGLACGWVLLIGLNFNGPRASSAGFGLGVPLVDWWFTQAKALLLYLKLAVWPWPLTIHYDFPLVQSPDAAWMFVLPVAVLVAATLVAVWRNWAVGFVGVWVLAILAPTLVVPIVKEVAAERRMYLPLVALVALAVVAAFEVARKYLAVDEETGARRLPPIAAVTVGALLVAMVFGQASIARLSVYGDAVNLWQSAVDLNSDDFIAQRYLGLALSHADRSEDAIPHFEQAMWLQPENMEVWSEIGLALLQSGRTEEAIEKFKDALQLQPDAADVHANYGGALFKAGRRDEAIAEYRKAIQLKPDSASAHSNLAIALRQMARTQEAIDEFQEALRLDPSLANAHNSLGFTLMQVGRTEDAIAHYRQALRLAPGFSEAYGNLGVALAQMGEWQAAVENYREAARLKPKYAPTFANLATAYAQLNRPTEAIATAEKAVSLARSQGDHFVADQIDGWLKEYRAQHSEKPRGASGSESEK